MKYKALMLDYDGTIAPANLIPQTPSKKVIAAIQKAQETIPVCVVTARPFNEAKIFISKLKLRSYSVLLNGAQIISSRTLKTIWKNPLTNNTIKKIYRIGKSYSFKIYAASFQTDMKITSINQLLNSEIADIYFENVPIAKFEDIKAELAIIPNISLHRIETEAKDTDGIDITDIHATKAHAISHLSKLLKVRPDHMIGVGDSYNDFPLLMACGLKVAMGNAVPELKAIADFIAPSVDEDSVATVIEKFIINQ